MSVRQENRWRRKLWADNDAASDRRREIEAATMVRGIRPPVIPPKGNATRRQVQAWMRNHSSEYDTATQLAEAANIVFDLPGDGLDDDSHWVWDEAAMAIEAVS